MALNDAVHWSADLGGGTRVALIRAGTFRSDAGALFGPVPRMLWDRLVTEELDQDQRLLQALNCLLVETPAGRVLVETGIGERVTDRVREIRGYEGIPVAPALAAAGVDPGWQVGDLYADAMPCLAALRAAGYRTGIEAPA